MVLEIKETERFCIFIDGANLYSAARGLGFDIDYKKLLELFRKQGRMVRAFYYTALFDDHEYSPIRPLVDWLDYNGYTMITKPAKEFTDAQGHRKIKGNMDMELAIDMLQMADHLEHVVLFSGDGDFRRLTEAVQHKGVRVTVVSTIRTQPPMIADELRRQADHYIDLMELRDSVARQFAQSPNPHPGGGGTMGAAFQAAGMAAPRGGGRNFDANADEDEDEAQAEAVVVRTRQGPNY